MHDSRIQSKTNGPSSTGDLLIQTSGLLSIYDRALIQNFAENSDLSGSTGSIRVDAGRILISYKSSIQDPEFTGIFNFNRNFTGNSGDLRVVSKGDIMLNSGYHYATVEENLIGLLDTGIGALSNLRGDASRVGEIAIHSGGRLSIQAVGEDMPKMAPAYFRFNAPTVAAGIIAGQFEANNDKNSQSNLPNIDITATQGVSLRNGTVLINGFNSGTIQAPTISIASRGPISLFRSSIGNAVVSSGNVSAAAKAAVAVQGNGIKLQDRSILFSNIPGGGIEINSSSGVFMASKIVDYSYNTGRAPSYGPSESVLYNASFGEGRIRINSPSNLMLFRTAIGGYTNNQRLEKVILDVGFKSDSILLSGASIRLGGNSQEFDLQRSRIDLDSKGLIPLFNVLNNRFFTNGGYSAGIQPIYPRGFNNVIEKVDNQSRSFDFSISGSLFGINGVLPSLNLPQFKDTSLGDACEINKTSSLSMTGRGKLQNPSSLIFD